MPDPTTGQAAAELSGTLHLDLDGRSLAVQVRRERRVRSPHTGRELLELHASVTTPEAGEHEWLSGALGRLAGAMVRSTDEAGDPAGKWILSWNSYAESSGLHTYSLILREGEELSLEALLLEELELYPYEYRERVVGEGLAIWTKLDGTQEELDRLRELIGGRRAFPVIRRGIHDQPREMRLGVAEWSLFEDRIKYRLVLVDAEISEEMRLELARIEEENSRAAVGYYESFLDGLSELLVRRGVLSEEDLRALQEAARAAPGAARREFWRVADVDALP